MNAPQATAWTQPPGAERPIRVLHVLNALNPGGVQSGLLQTFPFLDRERFRIDLMTGSPHPDRRFQAAFERIGVHAVHARYRERPLSFFGDFARLLRERGPFDVVHSHMRHYSGVVMRWAALCGVPHRIAHAHNDLSVWIAEAGLRERVEFALARRWVRRHATAWLAVSREAGRSLFGADCERDPRWCLAPSGIDLEPFEPTWDRAAVRADLDIDDAALVVGHVGRFHPQKNHRFLIEVFAEVRRRAPKARLVLVGEGEAESEARRRADELGVADAVSFLGVRYDVPRLMQGAFDVFVLPSRFEGLPRTVIEAQACALPCVISNGVTREADALPALVTRLGLGDPPDRWAREVIAAAARPRPIERCAALAEIRRMPLEAHQIAATLERIYSACEGARAGPDPG